MNLNELKKPEPQPPIITIVGTPGVGKTSLGALFPSPIFIQAEEGSTVFDAWDDDVKPVMFPVLPRAKIKNQPEHKRVSTKDSILSQLRDLLTQEHEFKTLVIDSVTSLHALFCHEVCEIYGTDNVADAAGGFHKGYLVVAEMHGEIKAACDILRKKKGMTVIFLAHCGIKKMKNRPDADEYTVYTLDMHEASIAQYTNLVDAVLYLRNEEFVTGQQSDRKGNITKFGRIMQTGQRVLVTSGDGRVGFVNAKNRYQLDAEIQVDEGENPLLDLIPYFVKRKKPETLETTEAKLEQAE